MTALEPRPTGGWDPDRRARALAPRRQYLLDRLSRKLPVSSGFSLDVREWIVDDAIEFAVLHYSKRPIRSRAELERVFWNAADRRVKRAGDGRYDIVRGAGNRRVDLAVLDELSVLETPEDELVALAERAVVLQFSALLDPEESDVYRCQRDHLDDPREIGPRGIASELDIPVKTVHTLLRTIETKRERFAIIYTAGRLCGFLAPGIAALAAEHDNPAADPPVTGSREFAARVHLEIERCQTCTADFARHLHYLRGARFHTKVAALLPAPELAERARASGLRELLPDWAARAVAHEPAGTAAQLAAGGAGRGLATTAAAHLAAFCLGGAGTLGACIATGVLPAPVRDNTPAKIEKTPPTPTPTVRVRPPEPEPQLPHGAVTATATPTATPVRRARKSTTRTRTTQGATGPRSHEQTPASPAPANAAPNGASEFDPTYQPSEPTAPAPAPAAPGASEFW